jgi:hypothetical protein
VAKKSRKPTAPRNPTDIIHLKLRLPESLRQTLARAALHHHQSMNAEIIERLEQSFDMPKAAEMTAEAVLQKIQALINPPKLIPPKSDEKE